MATIKTTIKVQKTVRTIVRGVGRPGTGGGGLSPIPANTLLGNNTGSSALPTGLTAEQARALLSVYSMSQVDTALAAKLNTSIFDLYVIAVDAALGQRVLTTDSRLANSREWTASTISQAEAEEGTATTRRAFTSERVRQAVIGWWNSTFFEEQIGNVYDSSEGIVALACSNFGWTFGSSIHRDNLRSALGAAAATHTHDASAIDSGTLADARLSANIPRMVGGLIQASNLPSYVDDVLEFANLASFPVTGETGKIYVALNTNLTYRWSGSAYVEISPSTAVWGSISGTLSSQTDLQSALDAKLNTSTAANSLLGNNTGSTAPATGLTAAQVRTLLGLATTDSPTFANVTLGNCRLVSTTDGSFGDNQVRVLNAANSNPATLLALYMSLGQNQSSAVNSQIWLNGNSGTLAVSSSGIIGFGSGNTASSLNNPDLRWNRDAANTSHQRNGTAGQIARWAKTWTSSTNNEIFEIDCAGNAATFDLAVCTGSVNATQRGLRIGSKFAGGAFSSWVSFDNAGAATFGSSVTIPGSGSASAPLLFFNGAGAGNQMGFYRSGFDIAIAAQGVAAARIGYASGICTVRDNHFGITSAQFDGVTAAADTRWSRASAGVWRAGTTANNALGSIELANITASGNITLTGLPTTNPGVAGRLWNDAGTLKIS